MLREAGAGRAFDWRVDGAADTLDGGAGDDTLILDRFDTATGGAGVDLFWLHHDATAGGGVADITDFQPGADFLRVSLNPAVGYGEALAVEVAPSTDGADAEVRVDGDLVAILRGAAEASASDVFVEVRADVFP